MHNKLVELSKLTKLKYAIIALGGFIFTCLLLFILFPDPIINTLFKDRINKTIMETFPIDSIQLGDLHYNIWNNRMSVDSVKLQAKDSAISVSVTSLTVGGIGCIKILWQRDLDSNNIQNLTIDIKQIVINLHKTQKAIHIGMLHISIPDSEMVSDSVKYFSLIDDEKLFAKSQFKQTRFNIVIPKIEIAGLDFLSILKQKAYKAESINIYNGIVDILTNKDKPVDTISPNPQMPNEAFSSIKELVKVDSLNIINGFLKYNERFDVGVKPGAITFNKINFSVIGITNHTEQPDTAIIIGEGLFMNSSKMKLFMAIPLSSPNFSLQYSGSFGKMDVKKLNSFIEASEQKRIKSGILQSATFNINVNSGRASGTVAIVYNDLSIVEINSNTGSENGIFDRIASIFGKLFVIRSSNMPDADGLIKTGEIKSVRKPANPFLQFVWLALRSGVGDIVGFPPEVISTN